MTDCPNCEYHKNRAARWRAEAYKQAGHPLPEREWVGLTEDEAFDCKGRDYFETYKAIEAKLKEKNSG